MSEEQSLTVFIDEAGDPGSRDGIRYYGDRYEWLTIAAVVMRLSREQQSVAWVRELRAAAKSFQGPSLHYARIAPARRTNVCEMLASKPVRAFCVLSHKSNVREYQNPKLGRFDQATFYNWCCRLLLERVMEWSASWMAAEGITSQPFRVVFSERGGHDYEHMFSYFDLLSMQHQGPRGMTLKPRFWSHDLLARSLYSIERHDTRAGLQLADIVASAFFQAANTKSPNWDVKPALSLTPIIGVDASGLAANFGVTVWPLKHQALLPRESRPIFEHYGYRF